MTLASEAWSTSSTTAPSCISKGFSGAVGCRGTRKSVRCDLPARPLDIQFSGVKDSEIAVIISPAEKGLRG